jgi:rubrerythrin
MKRTLCTTLMLISTLAILSHAQPNQRSIIEVNWEPAETLLTKMLNENIVPFWYPKTVDTTKLYDMAIAMEKSSLLFYTELIDGMSDRYQSEIDLIKGIRDEEKKHLQMLVKKKIALSK